MNLKRFAGPALSKRFLVIAASAAAMVAAISVVPEMQRMLAPTHASNPTGLNGTFVVQASGTAYFNPYQSDQPVLGTEVLHFTMAGVATYSNGSNTAANLTLNLGGEDDASSNAGYNELICYLTEPGDLFYTAGSATAPATLTVTYHAGDQCGNPNGLGNTGIGPNGGGGVSEAGKTITFNLYPGTSPAGVIVSNYTSYTSGSSGGNNYAQGWIDSGAYGEGSNVAYGFSVVGNIQPVSKFYWMPFFPGKFGIN